MVAEIESSFHYKHADKNSLYHEVIGSSEDLLTLIPNELKIKNLNAAINIESKEHHSDKIAEQNNGATDTENEKHFRSACTSSFSLKIKGNFKAKPTYCSPGFGRKQHSATNKIKGKNTDALCTTRMHSAQSSKSCKNIPLGDKIYSRNYSGDTVEIYELADKVDELARRVKARFSASVIDSTRITNECENDDSTKLPIAYEGIHEFSSTSSTSLLWWVEEDNLGEEKKTFNKSSDKMRENSSVKFLPSNDLYPSITMPISFRSSENLPSSTAQFSSIDDSLTSSNDGPVAEKDFSCPTKVIVMQSNASPAVVNTINQSILFSESYDSLSHGKTNSSLDSNETIVNTQIGKEPIEELMVPQEPLLSKLQDKGELSRILSLISSGTGTEIAASPYAPFEYHTNDHKESFLSVLWPADHIVKMIQKISLSNIIVPKYNIDLPKVTMCREIITQLFGQDLSNKNSNDYIPSNESRNAHDISNKLSIMSVRRSFFHSTEMMLDVVERWSWINCTGYGGRPGEAYHPHSEFYDDVSLPDEAIELLRRINYYLSTFDDEESIQDSVFQENDNSYFGGECINSQQNKTDVNATKCVQFSYPIISSYKTVLRKELDDDSIYSTDDDSVDSTY
eukprot:CAMPEP_0194374874 /NCGR_PEP_ID=MMETSP0174-20130528/23349_1 /TAXON_ID=216777 /ORGANISM="Proboscia alata, Strain PI-D3" /LENGTH=623 /DNA_ID=CAMNT_0039154735 /DNA_START=172 /DNA_END=2043 /DNA_ORIENTATION=+